MQAFRKERYTQCMGQSIVLIVAEYCPHCGRVLSTLWQSILSTLWQSIVHIVAEYCPHCGRVLSTLWQSIVHIVAARVLSTLWNALNMIALATTLAGATFRKISNGI